MTDQELWKRFSSLPADAKAQVGDLISFLYARLGPQTAAEPQPVSKEPEAFIGIWRGREDLTDRSAWVRRLREQEWSGHS